MESKFLDQDVDVVFLANKGIVIGSFVGRNYNKILMETGKFMDKDVRTGIQNLKFCSTRCYLRPGFNIFIDSMQCL